MREIDLLVVGAGPAGLGAAIEARRYGAGVIIVDDQDRPGGQLFKQIHKFFGSKEHQASIRGFKIGRDLLAEADTLGVEIKLSTKVVGILITKLYHLLPMMRKYPPSSREKLYLQPVVSKNLLPSRDGPCREL